MNETRTLHQLQTIDSEVDALTQESANVQARIGETAELLEARQRLDDARQRLHNHQTAQREQEWQVDILTEKTTKEEDRLYRGQIHSSRELESIRKEVEILKGSRRKLEDAILDLMVEVEQMQAEVASQQAELARVSAEWEDNQRTLAERQAQVEARLAELGRARKALASTLGADVLATYEDLRRMGRGRAVARIERNTCQGCRISLPMSIVQHVRAGRELVHCPSCRRVLFAER